MCPHNGEGELSSLSLFPGLFWDYPGNYGLTLTIFAGQHTETMCLELLWVKSQSNGIGNSVFIYVKPGRKRVAESIK